MKIKNIAILGFALILSSCTKNFEAINENPNQAPTSDPGYIFNYIIKEGAGEYGGSGDGAIYSTYNITYVQRWIMQTAAVWGNSTMPPYTLFDQYRIQNLWQYFYSDLLLNCRVLEVLTADDPESINKNHAATIWKAYNFQRVTDLWGDVPYSEALLLVDNFDEAFQKPAYDRQEDIYADLMESLKNAASFDPSKPFFSTDMIYGGDLVKWTKFANSLRLRMAVRSGDADVVKELVQQDSLISGNDESASFSYIASQLWWNPYYSMNIDSKNPSVPELTGTSVPKISELLVRQLQGTGDPRLAIYAQPLETDGVTIRGVPNLMNSTLKENQAMGIGVSSTSYIGKYFSENPTLNTQILSYSEVCFLRAEAAYRGWTTENAADWFSRGIRASMEYYQIEDTLITAFIDNNPYDGTLEQIITQKWVSLYLNGWEAFAEYRRTGFPQLKKWELELDGIKVKKAQWVDVPRSYLPGRLPYPDDEKDLNGAKYQEAVDRQGGDSYYQQVWWSRQFGEIDYSAR
ncbi:MAG: SusD/RagB family nutrient-binding outer membrane lipoprotein [Bacteroidota bacterium]